MATVRLENVRSHPGSKPTISRQPLRSGPHSTPSRSREPAAELLLVDRPGRLGPTRRAAWRRAPPRPRQGGGPGWPRRSGCAAAGRPPGWSGARTWPPPCPVGSRRRSPSICWRVAPARRSRKSRATATASTWAIDATAATSGDAERPQQRHALRAEKVTSNAVTVRGRPLARQQLAVGRRVPAEEQRPQLVGIDHAGQTRARRPAGPARRRAPHRHRRSSRRSPRATPPMRYSASAQRGDGQHDRASWSNAGSRSWMPPTTEARVDRGPRIRGRESGTAGQRSTDSCHPFGKALPGGAFSGPSGCSRVRRYRVRAIDTRPDGRRRDEHVDRLDEPAGDRVPGVVAANKAGGPEPPQCPRCRPRGQAEMVGDQAHARPGRPAFAPRAGVETDVEQDSPRCRAEIPDEGAARRPGDQGRPGALGSGGMGAVSVAVEETLQAVARHDNAPAEPQ